MSVSDKPDDTADTNITPSFACLCIYQNFQLYQDGVDWREQVKISVDKNIKGTDSRYTSAIPSYSVIS
jgi:hypothetical protein